MSNAVVTLKKGEGRALKQGGAWIFDNEMSKENAEQLLNSVMQDEKDVQDKVKKQQVLQGGRLEKDW